jgi:ribosomal small subunit protein bTHX
MGKGDKKSKRGKIIMGSYGVRRPQRTNTVPVAVSLKEEKPATKVKATKTETQVESPDVAVQVEEAAKPARKKTAPKASSKKDE